MDISVDMYEKLGAFYLGGMYDLNENDLTGELYLYDSKDLTTHAMCVGMTGSGKTGLCVSLLEEAAIDGIPAIVIDPKGDISNLLLTFPGLSAAEFRPWINEGEAKRKEMSPDQFAEAQAALWKKGLASWGEDGERIQRLKDSTDVTIYTPGSEAGVPVSIIDSFAPPSDAVLNDGDLFRDRINTTTTSILSLLGIDADPLRSQEHILIANLFDRAWRNGETLDLGQLIQQIQAPPIEKVGVLDMDSFYPADDRFELSMRLNNLLASPGFSTWLEGAPLDIDKILYSDNGTPRVGIFSIAHLSETERMFFVALLLNQVMGWMRAQSGTTTLRALLYIDELFGYMPPVANPPSKQPLLTMLKQARAFGLGLVLATQNPVDLDYKGLSNIGTWFIGRLQTERDKMRVLEGLEGAAAGAGDFDKGAMEETLAGLGKRVFLAHNVHEPEPVTFHTRWAMSYLRGPITRSQIKALMKERRQQLTTSATQPESSSRSAKAMTSVKQIIPAGIDQYYVPSNNQDDLIYRPMILGAASVHMVNTRKKLSHEEQVTLAAEIDDGPVPVTWKDATSISIDATALENEGRKDATFEEVPPPALSDKNYKGWQKDFQDELYHSSRYDLYQFPGLDMISDPGESERDFRIRSRDAAHEERDKQVEALREKYARKLKTADERIRKAEQKVDREQEQAEASKMQTMVNIGSTVLSAFLGRKAVSRSSVGKATTTMRGLSRGAKEKQDVERALDDLEARRDDFEELNRQIEEEIQSLKDRLDPDFVDLETVELKPRRTDIDVHVVGLAWVPFTRDGARLTPAW
ncbi:MAG: DUF87 domain-containing protein [Rhodothermales bacterium]|nr:DUF87 domain-containing protein [Rhodothermales bacterium]